MKLTVEQIAKVAHEANASYCRMMGETFPQSLWEDAPDWQKQSVIEGVRFHLETLAAGFQPTAMESHGKWLDKKREEGWKYGPVKDVEKKEHPWFVPYDELPVEQCMKDYLFAGVVEAFFRRDVEVEG